MGGRRAGSLWRESGPSPLLLVGVVTEEVVAPGTEAVDTEGRLLIASNAMSGDHWLSPFEIGTG